MSKSSLTIGMLIALIAHAAVLFVIDLSRDDERAEPRRVAVPLPALPEPLPTREPDQQVAEDTESDPEPEPVETEFARADVRGEVDGAETGEIPTEIAEEQPTEVAQVQPEPESKPEPEPEPQQRVETSDIADRGTEVAPEPKPQTERVTPSDVEVVRTAQRSSLPVKGDADGLPPVIVNWTTPKQAQEVARRLSFRIVAVDRQNNVLGQIAKVGDPRLIPVEPAEERFSNRARVIEDPLFFGRGVQASAGGRIATFLILVPTQRDRSFEWTVRRAIERAGLQPADVDHVEARFVTEGERDRLRIDRLHVSGSGSGGTVGGGDERQRADGSVR
ncbi:MAG: hypothetical protein AAGI17_07180 [Planctomycetota bacterium]